MSSRTLKEITSNGRGENKRHNHCPWEMMKMLETMEEDILQEKEQQREMKKNRIIRDGINYKEPELEDDAPYNPNLIWEGDECARCGTGWHCLVPDGKDAWGRTVVVCRICSTDNIVEQIELDPDDPDQRPPKVREFIEPYWNCWQCNARFHNLKRERVDRWGNTVYICVRCAHTNRIRPGTAKSWQGDEKARPYPKVKRTQIRFSRDPAGIQPGFSRTGSSRYANRDAQTRDPRHPGQ